MENNNTVSPELRDEIAGKASSLLNARNYNNPVWNAGFYEGYETGATKYASKWEQSEERRRQAMELLDPILEWGQSKEAEIKLGESITKVVLERATLWQRAEAEKKQLRDVLKYIREVIRFEFNTEDIIAFINDKLTQLPSEGDAFEEEKPEGPWDVKYMGSVSSTEAGTEYDDWIEITDGKVTLYLDGGLEDNDEQLLVNFLNARKIKLDYDHESELAAHLLEQELKRANRVVQAQEEYIELLVKEIESMVAIAYVHGWRSDNHEKGARVREKIAALKEGRKEVENG